MLRCSESNFKKEIAGVGTDTAKLKAEEEKLELEKDKIETWEMAAQMQLFRTRKSVIYYSLVEIIDCYYNLNVIDIGQLIARHLCNLELNLFICKLLTMYVLYPTKLLISTRHRCFIYFIDLFIDWKSQ